MKIVIDIDEKNYKRLIRGYIDFITLPKEVFINGTLLPKNHGRLIDADLVVDGFEDNYELCIAVNNTTTIIKAEREDIFG